MVIQKKYFSLLVILLFLPAFIKPAYSQESFIDKETLKRSISANQALLNKFEKQASKAGAGQEKMALEIKINKLKSENQLLRQKLFGVEPKSPEPKPLSSESKSMSKVISKPASKPMDLLTGSDWFRMSATEKERFVYTGIGGLERQGVFVMRPPKDYLEALDKVLAAEPELQEEFLENIFVFCVYDAEPQTRTAIRKIRDSNKNSESL